MLLNGLFAAYLLLFVALLGLKFRSRDFFETLPSLFWFSIMVLPFWLQREVLSAHADGIQAYGILGVGFALLVADGWEARLARLVNNVPPPSQIFLAQCLFILVAGLQVIHMGLLGDIRLFSWMRGESDHQFLFELDHLLWLKTVLLVGTPVTLALLIRSRRTGLVMSFYILSLFYGFNISHLTGLTFLILGFLLYGLEMVRFFSRKIWLVLGAIVFIPAILLGFSLSKKEVNALTSKVSSKVVEERVSLGEYRANGFERISQGDHFRFMSSDPSYKELGFFSRFLNGTLFDIFIEPVESSAWWYDYFSRIEVDGAETLDMSSLFLGRTELLSPANRVGIWALSRRFPGQYTEISFVVPSVDADAYARWGTKGLMLVVAIIFIVRIVIKKLKVRSPWGDSINLIVLFLLSLGLVGGSVFGMIGGFGVGLGVLLMGSYYLVCRNYLKEDYLPSTRSFEGYRADF